MEANKIEMSTYPIHRSYFLKSEIPKLQNYRKGNIHWASLHLCTNVWIGLLTFIERKKNYWSIFYSWPIETSVVTNVIDGSEFILTIYQTTRNMPYDFRRGTHYTYIV